VSGPLACDVLTLLKLMTRPRQQRRVLLIARQLGDWWTQLAAQSNKQWCR
jgi:hypothetical protein